MRLRPLSSSLFKVISLVILMFSVQGGSTLITGLFSLGDSQAINDSGSLRMRAYQLAVLMQSEPSQVPAKLAEYEEVLYSPALARTLNWYMPRGAAGNYQRVIHEWQGMKALARSGDLARYQARVAGFVDRIHALVDALEDFSHKKLRWLVITQLGAMLLVLVGAWLAYRSVRQHLVYPLEGLEQGAKGIAKGQFEFSAPVTGFRELSTLGETLTDTGKELDTLYRQLNKKVEAQDLALKQAHQRLSFLYQAADTLNNNELTPEVLHQVLAELQCHLGAKGVELALETEPAILLGSGPWAQSQPLAFNGVALGTLNLALAEGDDALIGNFCQLLAQTLYRHQDRQAQQRLGLMEERATIARELHDSLGQLLAYMKIQLTLLNRATQAGDLAQVAEAQAALKSSVDKAYGQLRELLATFRLKLEEPDLNRGLDHMLDDLRQRTSTKIHLDYQLPVMTLGSTDQVHLLQLVREAVTNAIKHAQADNIWIWGLGDHRHWGVVIEDDGVGMTMPEDPNSHFGLGIMAERARRLGARFTQDDSPRGGVRIRLTFNKETHND